MPSDTTALSLLAVVKFRTEKYAEAQSAAAAVHRLQPKQPDVIGLLALVHKEKREFPEAVSYFEQLVELGLGSPDVFNQIGSCWLGFGDPSRAGAAFRRAIELDRGAAHSYFNLALALKLAGSSYETFYTFRRSFELDPARLETYIEIWQQMTLLQNWAEGAPILEQGVSRHDGSLALLIALATTYGKLGKVDRAEGLFRAASAKDPAALIPYAHWMQEEGRFAESVPLLVESLRRNPGQGQAYYNLTEAKCFEIGGKPLFEMASSALTNPQVSTEERMFLHYALAKDCDGKNDYEAAMHHFDLANESAYNLYNPGVKHDEAAAESEYRGLERIYTSDALESLSRHGSSSDAPIFIVGMIRTGTTLLEQTLSRHPYVESAGEQPFWRLSAGSVNHRWLKSGCDERDLADLETRYLRILRGFAPTASRIIDKMPTNFYHLGLIASAFPMAKMIHVRRIPMDTVTSIYTTFLGKGTQFAYNQENIVGYYRVYMRLMDLWRSVLPPDRMIEIDYEELVTDREGVLRNILDFCGLPWNEAVLSNERRTGAVTTPSLWTARQPVTSSSVARWRRYEPWLGGLLALRDVTHPPRKGA